MNTIADWLNWSLPITGTALTTTAAILPIIDREPTWLAVELLWAGIATLGVGWVLKNLGEQRDAT